MKELNKDLMKGLIKDGVLDLSVLYTESYVDLAKEAVENLKLRPLVVKGNADVGGLEELFYMVQLMSNMAEEQGIVDVETRILNYIKVSTNNIVIYVSDYFEAEKQTTVFDVNYSNFDDNSHLLGMSRKLLQQPIEIVFKSHYIAGSRDDRSTFGELLHSLEEELMLLDCCDELSSIDLSNGNHLVYRNLV